MAWRLLFDPFSVEVSRASLVPDRVDAGEFDVVAKGGGAGRSDADGGSGADG